MAAALAVACAAALAFVHFRETPPVDGRNLAFISDEGGPFRMWVRPLDGIESRQIPGTDGATYPFWSPHGANLGFFSQGKLKKIALAGGPAQTRCDAPTSRGGAWNRGGAIVFAPIVNGGLYRVSEEGGVPAPLTKVPAAGIGGVATVVICSFSSSMKIL